MATKTLTITENAYNLLAGRKEKGESFSEEIRRLLSDKKKKRLIDFFGIISKAEGAAMLKDLENIRKINIELQEERLR